MQRSRQISIAFTLNPPLTAASKKSDWEQTIARCTWNQKALQDWLKIWKPHDSYKWIASLTRFTIYHFIISAIKRSLKCYDVNTTIVWCRDCILYGTVLYVQLSFVWIYSDISKVWTPPNCLSDAPLYYMYVQGSIDLYRLTTVSGYLLSPSLQGFGTGYSFEWHRLYESFKFLCESLN